MIAQLKPLIAACSLLALCCAAPVCAQSPAPDDDGPAVSFFPGPLMPLPASDDKPASTTTMGWDVGGAPLRPGPGWWALVCQPGCALFSTGLKTSRITHTVKGQAPFLSQALRWSPLPAGLEQAAMPASTPEDAGTPVPLLIAIFKPVAPMALHAGPVTTWLHAAQDSYPPHSHEGAMGVQIPLPHGKFALLLPRARFSVEQQGEVPAPEQVDVLELRAYGRRQALPPYRNFSSQDTFDAQAVLRWAGDLDGDGKLDLIVSHDQRDIDVALYLSSLAGPDEIVGLAGSMQYVKPADTEK